MPRTATQGQVYLSSIFVLFSSSIECFIRLHRSASSYLLQLFQFHFYPFSVERNQQFKIHLMTYCLQTDGMNECPKAKVISIPREF